MATKKNPDNPTTTDDVLLDVEDKMDKAVEALKRDLNTLRTGRATPSLIENISVDYYGTPTPLKQIASISLTTERRQDLVKVLKRKIEEGKVSVRNVRRGGQDTLRRMEKDKLASQDQVRRAQDQLQKATDEHTKTMDQVAAAKEAEIMQV